MTHKSVKGIVPVLPTPFRPDESVDLDSLKRIVRFCAGQGFSAICLPAYASEFYKLGLEERCQLVATAVQAAEGEIQVIAQSNHYSGAHASEIAVQNEKIGADVISVAVPRMFEIGDIDVFRFLAGTGAGLQPGRSHDQRPDCEAPERRASELPVPEA